MGKTRRNDKRWGAVTSVTAVALTLALTSSGASIAGAASAAQQQSLPTLEMNVPGPLAANKPPTPLLDSRLSQLADIARQEGRAAARRFAAVNAIPLDDQGRVNVLIHEIVRPDYDREAFSGDDPEQRIGRATYGEEAIFEALEVSIRSEVERLNGAVRGRVSNLVDASLPISSLRSLDGASGMGWIEPSPVPQRTVVSEGVNVIQASALQAAPVSYLPGDPVKVGIIDLGFKGYRRLLGSELPATVTVESFHPGGIDGVGEDLLDQVHGTACAEIVFDVAPEAELYFANFDSVSDNDRAVDWMIDQGVDVISYSIGWFNAGPGDGRGPINAAVDRALDQGIQWVTSAGNEARDHWQGQYSDPDGDGIHNFAAGDESNAVFLGPGDELVVFLNWDDWFASNQDYDLYILNDAGQIVAASETFQTGVQNPAEAAGFAATVAGTYHVVITRFDATRAVNLEMFFNVAREMQYIVSAGSITIPADTDGAVAVGATFWGDDLIEEFSSQGPTADGRMKPDLAAPDGVSTVSFGDLGLAFFGTSSSAPHTAGAIALLKSRFGVFSLDQIRDILYGRSIDRGAPGMDNIYGHGRLDVKGQ